MKPRVVVSVPSATGKLDIKLVWSLFNILSSCQTIFFPVTRRQIVRARDDAAKFTIGKHPKEKPPTKPTHLFMMDDDNPIEENGLSKMLAADKDIVGVVTRRRGSKDQVCVHESIYRDSLKDYTYHLINDKKINSELMEVPAMGFGAVLIKIEVLEELYKYHHNPFCQIVRTSGEENGQLIVHPHLGEDISFCINARKLGFKCYVDTTIKTKHVELPKTLDWDGFMSYNDNSEVVDIKQQNDTCSNGEIKS